MTIDEFLKKYNRCPFCKNYVIQNAACDGCKWADPIVRPGETDKFGPKEEWIQMMNEEVDE